ncbi:recombinase family protein [Peribacillus frigoritolerans]|uniref:recombinase family protein n=1 Tax=Peribacillus frigoritolerans TaxID=450367 RepID=UPI003D32D1A8
MYEKKITTRDENQWNDKPLMQIIKNPLYCGTIKWGDVLAVDSVPLIIDKDTYNALQRTIERRKSLSPKHISSEYIFSGSHTE